MKLLVVGHSLVVDANRKFWSHFSREQSCDTDLVTPLHWSSNLQKKIPFQPHPETDQGIRAIFPVRVFFKGNGSLYFHSPASLFRILSQKKYDHIFLNQETWALSSLLFIFLKTFTRNRKTPLYLCVAQNIRKHRLKFLHPYERWISRFVTSFLYCSEGVRDVLEWKGIKTRTDYFPLPYDEEKFTIEKFSPGDTLRLGYLGRLSEDKGIDRLIAACEELVKRKFEFKLVIGGSGPLAQTLKEKPYVEFLGLIPHRNAFEFYKKIDVFILPSQTLPHWKEQFGRVIVESFGSGVPVIGSDSGSIPEVLKYLDWDWVFPENSQEALVEKIIALREYLESTTGQDQLNRSVQKNVDLFSQSAVSDRLKRIFLA